MPRIYKRETLVQRLDKYTDKTPGQGPQGDCWGWTGCTVNGYGSLGPVKRETGTRRAHRIRYELVYGAIKEGLFVLHTCDNRSCTNPDHLELGSQADNLRQMAVRERTGNRKLTNQQAIDIKALWDQGWTLKIIARKYGIDPSTAHSVIRKRKAWKHL